ncbi:ATP-binding protein [Streptomyces sp. T028]|uniref:ATP-binding protein n=1 Tax=Streptomyces sp. T028 TaxID=3394379 RepID=UPI003A872B8D
MNETIQLPPLRERFFRRERRSVPAARLFATETLAGWGLAGTERADDVLLCVSELVTNALLHGVPPGRQFLLFLRYDGQVIHVEVHDSGPGVPRVVEPEGEGGRGLLLVAALSDDWGVRERPLGKAVWCEFVSSGRGPGHRR